MNRQELIEQARAVFRAQFGGEPEITLPAPGRVNLIGEHTDYNDGHVLPVAIDRFTVAAAAQRSDHKLHLYTATLNGSFTADLDRVPEQRPHWASYILGVLYEMRDAGVLRRGKNLAIVSNVPMGAGVSSSAALEVSVATAVERLEGTKLSDAEVVQLCRRADHRYVGINSGPMDQFASRACRAGHAGLLDCRSLEMSHHLLPADLLLLSVYSGIPRALAESEYNERQGACQLAVKLLQQVHPEIRALRDATPVQIEDLREHLGEKSYRRARHVVTEQARVFEMVRALQEKNFGRIGKILLEGHQSLSRDYEVSLPILDEMVDWLMRQPGVVGARLTGAGFGGSLVCLVEKGKFDFDAVRSAFSAHFSGRTPEPPEILLLESVDGAAYAMP